MDSKVTKVILALDGGATKTAVKVMNGEQELLSIIGRSSNYQAIGEKKVAKQLYELLKQVAALNVTVDAAVFAIAGIDTLQDKIIVQKIVASCIKASELNIISYVVENDVEATLHGLCEKTPGALVISGTGAIGYSYDGEHVYRVGGWGHRVGDEGSGYWIGQAIIQAVLKAADGRGKKTVLSEYALHLKEFTTTDELINWLYREDYRNSDLANFASLLQQAVDIGDEMALRISERAAEELFCLAQTLLKPLRCELNSSFTFYLNGGVLKNNRYIYNNLIQGIQNVTPQITIKLCEQKPIDAIIARANYI